MFRSFVLSTALVLTAATSASAQPPQPPPVGRPSLPGLPILGQGSDQERAACHPDVVKYCKELIKDDANADVFAILNCLQTNRPRISKACGEVLASHGQ
jgi:hypothetical protein